MADNPTVTNKKTTFEADTNPDYKPRTTQLTDTSHVQHIGLSFFETASPGIEIEANSTHPFPTKIYDSYGQKIVSDSNVQGIIVAGAYTASLDIFTATGINTPLPQAQAAFKYWSLQIIKSGTVTTWSVDLQLSLDATNFFTILTHSNANQANKEILFAGPLAAPSFQVNVTSLSVSGGGSIEVLVIGTI